MKLMRRFTNKGECKSLLRAVVNEKKKRAQSYTGWSSFLIWCKMRHYCKQLGCEE